MSRRLFGVAALVLAGLNISCFAAQSGDKVVSPYLTQHADNPIDWQVWSSATLASAKSSERLIFLSIGYATCHWCHVMNRESFSSPVVADALQDFVAIKVDREEHPNIDAYFNDLLVLSGRTGGWPVSAVLTPDGTPIAIENYLSQPDLLRWLASYHDQFLRNPDLLYSQSQVWRQLASASGARAEGASVVARHSPDVAAMLQHSVARVLDSQFDWEWGGLQGEAKFPAEPMARAMLEAFRRGDTHRPQSLGSALRKHLDMLIDGGLRDPFGGGYFRYATQRDWAVPHFEKMLYTQAQLIELFALAGESFGESRYVDEAYNIVGFLRDAMRAKDSPAYVSALDAEYLSIDGGWYSLGESAASNLLQDLPQLGEGLMLLDSGRFRPAPASHFRWSAPMHWRMEQALRAQREEGGALFRDEKVILGWNALLARSLIVLARSDDNELRAQGALDEARRLTDWLLSLRNASTGSFPRYWLGAGSPTSATQRDTAWLLSAGIALQLASKDPARETLLKMLAETLADGVRANDESPYTPLLTIDRELPQEQAVVLSALEQASRWFNSPKINAAAAKLYSVLARDGRSVSINALSIQQALAMAGSAPAGEYVQMKAGAGSIRAIRADQCEEDDVLVIDAADDWTIAGLRQPEGSAVRPTSILRDGVPLPAERIRVIEGRPAVFDDYGLRYTSLAGRVRLSFRHNCVAGQAQPPPTRWRITTQSCSGSTCLPSVSYDLFH